MRAIIELKSVKYRLENNIGYIRVSSFNQKVDEEIKKAIKQMQEKNKNEIVGYVLDLQK